MMYTKVVRFIVMLALPSLLMTGCEEDEVLADPSITFSTSRASLEAINLDENTGPYINGWAVAPAGLASVVITVDRTGGAEEVLNITEFNDDNSERDGTAYRFYVLPEYTPDFQRVTAVVTDKKNKTAEVMWEVSATGGTAGPKLEGFPADPIEANVRPSVDIRPRIIGQVSSHWGLASVSLVQVYAASESELQVVTDFGETPNQYTVDVLPDYDEGYAQGMTGFKVHAVDNRGNESELVIPVSVIDASSAPRIEFDATSLEADLLATPQVTPAATGSVSSLEGLASVSFFVVRSTGDVQFGETVTSFTDVTEYIFNVDPPYSLGVTGLKVVSVDLAGQTSQSVLPVTVIDEDPDLSTYTGVVLNGTADRHDPGVHTCFSTRDGIPYTLFDPFNDAGIAATVDFIVADSGGDNELDIFSPAGNDWLDNNYFKDELPGDTEWPVLNETQMRQLNPGEIDFASATSMDIAGLDLGADPEFRVEPLFVGDLVLFVTSEGKKGIISYVSTNDDPGKADVFTFDIKVIK